MTVAFIERPTDAVVDERLADLRAAVESAFDDRFKVEILGGDVTVSPLAMTMHDKIVNRMYRAFDRVLDEDEFDLTQRVELVVDACNRPQPDLAVLWEEFRSETLLATQYRAHDALMVAEVTSPSNAASDRKWGAKYKAYAKGLVPLYILVDPHADAGPIITVFSEPTGTRYNTETTVKFGEPLRLPEPFAAVKIDSNRFQVPGV